MEAALSRRGILGALAIVPAAALALPTMAAPGASGWTKQMALYERARAARTRFNADTLKPLQQRIAATAPRPDFRFQVRARSGQAPTFWWDPSCPDEWDGHISPVFAEKAGAIRRAWGRHVAERGRLGFDALEEESERLCAVECDQQEALLLMPAPDRAALLWKLEQLYGPEARDDDRDAANWPAEWINAVMADARRLLGGLN